MLGTVERLFHDHYKPLCAFVDRYVGSSDGAEDVVQDVFVRFWQRREECRDPQRYLYVAVRNRALQHQAHDRIVRKVRRTLQDTTESKRAPRPDEELAASELMDALGASVARLPSRQREAYTRHWNGRAKAEIAEAMRISVRTVETHVGEAKRALRRELASWM